MNNIFESLYFCTIFACENSSQERQKMIFSTELLIVRQLKGSSSLIAYAKQLRHKTNTIVLPSLTAEVDTISTKELFPELCG